MEASPCLLGRWDGAVRTVFLDKRLPPGALFIAPIHTEVHRKTDGATDIMTRDGLCASGYVSSP